METLVEKLSQIDGRESIEINTAEGGELTARIIRDSTGEVLAEVGADPDLGPYVSP